MALGFGVAGCKPNIYIKLSQPLGLGYYKRNASTLPLVNPSTPRPARTLYQCAIHPSSGIKSVIIGIDGLPPDNASISQINRDVVPWRTVPRRGQDGERQRGIRDGTLNGVTYVKANSWVQVSGT